MLRHWDRIGSVSPDQEIAQRLHTAIETYGIPASIRQKAGATSTRIPPGVRRVREAGLLPVNRSRAAPEAARAAQLPVVYPQRSIRAPLRM